MKKKSLLIPLAVSFSMLMLPSAGAVASENSGLESISEQSAFSTVPSEIGEIAEVSLDSKNGLFKTKASNAQIGVPQHISDEQGIGYVDSDVELEIFPEFLPSTEGALGENGEIIYAGDNGAGLTVAPKEDQSLQLLVTIPNSNSDTRYSYDINSIDYQQMEINEDGSVSAFNANGEFVFGIAAPWAKDSAGLEIPTWFEIEGKSLTQVVDHASGDYSYPVVADPWLGKDLYSKVYVSYKSQGYVVNATPSTWGKTFVGVATWGSHIAEVKSKANNKWNASIENQMKCHLLGFPLSLPEYNLESWRPNVHYVTSLAKHKCNPGSDAGYSY